MWHDADLFLIVTFPPGLIVILPPRPLPPSSLLRQCLVHGIALAAAGGSSAIAWWAVAQIPNVWLIASLLFGRTTAALAFRFDRLRWSEWSERDARFFAVATICGAGLAAALSPNLLSQTALRVLFVEALVYGVGGLALADLLRARRRKSGDRVFTEPRPCLVYGSRGAGRQLAQQLLNESAGLRPFAYLDEDPLLEATIIDGLPVLGCLEDLQRLAAVHNITDVVAAAPSEDLIRAAEEAGVRVHYGRIEE